MHLVCKVAFLVDVEYLALCMRHGNLSSLTILTPPRSTVDGSLFPFSSLYPQVHLPLDRHLLIINAVSSRAWEVVGTD